MIEPWGIEYNICRRDSALRSVTPAEFARQWTTENHEYFITAGALTGAPSRGRAQGRLRSGPCYLAGAPGVVGVSVFLTWATGREVER